MVHCLGPHESAPERHLDRFSRFCVYTAKTDRNNIYNSRLSKAKFPNAFLWEDNHKNCLFPFAMHGSMGPSDSALSKLHDRVLLLVLGRLYNNNIIIRLLFN